MKYWVRRETPERNPVQEGHSWAQMLLSKGESAWQQMFTNALTMGKKFDCSPKSIPRHKPWGKQASLGLALMPSLFKCHLFVLREISLSSSGINTSEIIPFWTSWWGPEVTDWGSLGAKLWRSLWNHLQPKPLSLHLLSSRCLLYSVKTILVLAGMVGLVWVWFWWFCFVLFEMFRALSFL